MDEKTIKILLILCVVIFGTLIVASVLLPVLKLFLGFELFGRLLEVISQL